MKSLYLFLSFLVFVASQSENSKMTRKLFVNGHNSRRLKVAKGEVKGQPPAAKMNKIKWDKELYSKASEYVATFPTRHNPDRRVPSGRFKTGDNLYYSATTDRNHNLDINEVLKAWFSEHEYYKYGSAESNEPTGHYTQMVWSDSIYLGCAISQRFKDQWKEFFVVCNYGPPGNYLGEVPYKKGHGVNELS